MKRLSSFLLAIILIMLTSCAAQQKAFIDKSAMKQIIWPGQPEKPRIQYLWSITSLSGIEDNRKRGIVDVVLGKESDDKTDPRTSGTLMRPYGLFMDSRNKLYITDPGAYRFTIVDVNTEDVINIYGFEDEEFISPIGIVADLSGRIYLTDSVLRKVLVFNEKGGYLFSFDGEFKRPTGLAIDKKNTRIYVADTLEHCVYVYTLDGKRTGRIGKPGSLHGEFNFPTHLFVDRNDQVYVTDAMNFRVQIFSVDGTYLESIGYLGDAYGSLDKPKGVAADSQDNIYVVDAIKDTVKIFDHSGNLLLFFGITGQRYGDFYLPSGIFIDHNDNIYVADTYNKRVQVFQYIGGAD